MQLEAPGTYHHSLIVASLAENAANAIGAHPLLARVGALFHDIGKINHPAFFSENLRDRSSPHDERTPLESARIIRQHVSDGVELAARHELPRAIVDVIRQHHGTSMVRYFYDRALAAERARSPGLAGEAKPVSEEPFRYEGPRPQFKESAIISLADGVEAASRSLRTATPEALRELIDRIVRDRIYDRQLDEAPLTFEEITKVKNSFQFTLLNMLHARVAYPAGESPGAAAHA
jgi:putative nucleotidyltransferase with HDIG domain